MHKIFPIHEYLCDVIEGRKFLNRGVFKDTHREKAL